MKISDLKSGMLVEFDTGQKSIVLLDTPHYKIVAAGDPGNHQGSTWCPISSKPQTKINKPLSTGIRIVKVWGYNSNMRCLSFDTSERILLYEEKLNTEQKDNRSVARNDAQ